MGQNGCHKCDIVSTGRPLTSNKQTPSVRFWQKMWSISSTRGQNLDTRLSGTAGTYHFTEIRDDFDNAANSRFSFPTLHNLPAKIAGHTKTFHSVEVFEHENTNFFFLPVDVKHSQDVWHNLFWRRCDDVNFRFQNLWCGQWQNFVFCAAENFRGVKLYAKVDRMNTRKDTNPLTLMENYVFSENHAILISDHSPSINAVDNHAFWLLSLGHFFHINFGFRESYLFSNITRFGLHKASIWAHFHVIITTLISSNQCHAFVPTFMDRPIYTIS